LKLENWKYNVVEDGLHGEGDAVSSGGGRTRCRRHHSYRSRVLLLEPCDVII